MNNKEDKYDREDEDISMMTMTSTVTVIIVEMTMKLYRYASRHCLIFIIMLPNCLIG